MRLKALALAGIAASMIALPAIAHHSFAMFDNSQTSRLTGTVTDFEWINPHVWLHIEVGNEDGSTAVWSFEAGSTGQLTQSLWTPDSVAPGDVVDVGFHPLKDGSNGGQLMDATLPDGINLCQGAACRERLREEGVIPRE
jgi:hypothetical protein